MPCRSRRAVPNRWKRPPPLSRRWPSGEPDDGGDKPDAGFAEIKSQDSGTTGTERLSFTARSTGTIQVRVRNFGIGESDGSFTLVVRDLGS